MPTKTEDPLVSFIYQLLRDCCTAGEVEKVVRDEEEIAKHAYWHIKTDTAEMHIQTATVKLSNEYIAGYANELVVRLRKAWGPKLGVPHLTNRQWEIIEEALDAHSYELEQKLSHEDEWDEIDLEQWKRDLDAVKELENLVHFLAHPDKEKT